jgi:hypothetical protein
LDAVCLSSKGCGSEEFEANLLSSEPHPFYEHFTSDMIGEKVIRFFELLKG